YDIGLYGLQIEPVLASVGGDSYVYLYSLEGEVYRVALDGNEEILLGLINPDYATTAYDITVIGVLSEGVYAADFRFMTPLEAFAQ
ncbi:MAG: hypothetical protein R3Y06_08165, partial [Faecalibacterium sp.]